MLIPKQAKDIAWNAIGDKVIILELRDNRMFHELNGTAGFLWTQMTKHKNTTELALCLGAEFKIPTPQAETDTNNFIKKLIDLKLVTNEL